MSAARRLAVGGLLLLVCGCGGSSSARHLAAGSAARSCHPISPARGTQLMYRVTDGPRPTPAAFGRATTLIDQRLAALGIKGRVVVNCEQVIVEPAAKMSRPPSVVGMTGRLELFDWEANVLTARGQTAAQLLASRQGEAIELSQGAGNAAPGQQEAGSLPLEAAVALAARQPARSDAHATRPGPQFYAFAQSGSPACADAPGGLGAKAVPGVFCLAGGPSNTLRDIQTSRSAGVRPLHTQIRVVQPGTLVMAAYPYPPSPVSGLADPLSQFYVVRDNIAWNDHAIANLHAVTGPHRQPELQITFTPAGLAALTRLTAALARRGRRFGQSALQDPTSYSEFTGAQHLAIAIDDQLLAVPAINFTRYPTGIHGGITVPLGNALTIQTAQAVATDVRLGPLPIALSLISAN